MPSLTRTLLTAAFAVTCTASAFGQTIVYGDFEGDTVTFENVRENANGLFEAPTVSGDQLTFSPSDFRVQSTNADGIAFADGFLGFVLQADPGQALSSFSLEESGAYRLSGTGTDDTQVTVDVVFSINVLEVDGVAFNGPSQFGSSTNLLLAELATDGAGSFNWQGTATVDLITAAAELGITGDITRASIVLDNQIEAISESGSLAFVDKKNVDGVIITVPEPASLVLLAFGGVAVLGRRRG